MDQENNNVEKELATPIGNRSLLPQQIADKIDQLIRERDLKPGDRIPNEFELASQLHVGRGTIREAIKLLTARNILEIRRGKGTYVCGHTGQVEDPLGLAYVQDRNALVNDLMELRLHLEPWIAQLAAERITDAEMPELRAKCDKVKQMIESGKEHREADVEFHRYLAQCTHNSVIPRLIPTITYGVNMFTELKDPALLRSTILTHQGVTDAVCAHNGEAAYHYMYEHLSANKPYFEKMSKKNTEDMS